MPARRRAEAGRKPFRLFAGRGPPLEMRQPPQPKSPATPSRLRRLYARHGLAASVVLLCLLLCAVLWTGLFMFADYERDRIVESKRHENANLARMFEEHVSRTLRAAEVVLREIASGYRRSGTKFDLVRYAKDRRIALDPYIVLSIIDKKGDLILANPPPPPNTLNLSRNSNYRHHLRDDTRAVFISEPRFGLTSGKWTVYLSTRVNEADGSFGGLAAIGMDPAYFSRIYAELDLGRDAIVVLVGIDGVVRVRASGSNVTAGQNVVDSQVFRLLQATNHGSVVAPSMLDQVTRIFSYRTLKDYPLAVVIGTSQTAALSAHVNRMSIYLQAAGAVTAAILGLGLFALLQIRRKEKTNEALRASEDKFSKAFHASPDYIALSKRESGEILEVNEGFERISGHSRGEAIGRTAIELGIWKQPEQRAALVERLVADGVVHNAETELRRKDGEERVLLVSVDTIDLDGGKSMLTVGRDITERRRAEEAEHDSRRRLQSILDSIFARVGLFSLEGVVIEANRALVEVAGQKRESVIGKPLWDAYWWSYSPASQQRVREALRRAAQGETVRDDFRVRLAENVFITIDATFGPVRDEKGRVTQLVGSSVDVTERRLAEAAVRESEAKLDEAQRVAQLGSWELDLVRSVRIWSDEIFHILEIDKERFGATREAFLNATHPEDREAVDAAYARSLETRTPYDITFRLLMADGRIKYLHSRCESHFDIDGKPIRSLGTLQDVTEQTLAELEIRKLNTQLEQRVRERTGKLAAANKELETFSYSVAHDLRAPLRGIDGYSRLLQADYADKLDDEGRGFLRNIVGAAKRMSELIDDLLAYSHLEHRDMHLAKVDPRALIESLLTDRADEISARGVAVSVAVACPSVTADREGLAMALRNLLENALKFTRDAVKPTIEIGARDEGAACILWVRDNGVGFDMQFHDRIFDIFQRLHRSEDYPGTGVGLAIVKKAMERMGGRAWAESAPGKGATFFLEIPE